MQKKKLPVGIDDFEKLRKEDFYYIDKTGLICDLLHNWGEVNLFIRLRRFGKTLNMSMLKSFFEIGTDKTLFEGLAISQETALCEDELDSSILNLWSVLFTTGYLTQADRAVKGIYKLIIPNRETREVFVLQIQEWFRESVVDDEEPMRELLCQDTEL